MIALSELKTEQVSARMTLTVEQKEELESIVRYTGINQHKILKCLFDELIKGNIIIDNEDGNIEVTYK